MPLVFISIAISVLWYFGVWPFDGSILKARDTTYVAEVGYYVGTEVNYETGAHRKTIEQCRADATSIAEYRGRNSPTRVVSQTCYVYINGALDHRE